MRNRVTLLVLALVVCLPNLSDAAHHRNKLSGSQSGSLSGQGQGHESRIADYAGRVVKANVSVVVERIGADQTKDIFGVDLVGRGVQPLTIQIQNRSGQTYTFRKANVDEHYISAAEAARYACPNPIITGLRFVRWIVCWIPAYILEQFVESFEGATRRPLTNQDIRAAFMKEEITDTAIGPNGSLSGFMFIRPPPRGSRLNMKLINVQTQEPLVFEVPL